MESTQVGWTEGGCHQTAPSEAATRRNTKYGIPLL